MRRSIHLALAGGPLAASLIISATAGKKQNRDIVEEVTSGTSTQPPSPRGVATSLGSSPSLPDDQGRKGVEQNEGAQPGVPDSDPEQPMHAGAQMVLVLTTTLVHLAVLGSGALFASWRAEDQVRALESRVLAADQQQLPRFVRVLCAGCLVWLSTAMRMGVCPDVAGCECLVLCCCSSA